MPFPHHVWDWLCCHDRVLEFKIAVLFNILQEAAFVKNTEHDRRNFPEIEHFSTGKVLDGTGREVHFQLITILNLIGIADQDRHSLVNGIAEEDAGNRFCENGADSGHLNHQWGMFATGAQPKLLHLPRNRLF